MGLEGTLRVFSINDIFQVLGLQRKSGVLVVEGPDDTVTISFLGGQVVSAESATHRLDNRIGSLLVRGGRINDEQLARILQLQKESQQRLGFLLIRERLVTPEDLREALRLQIFRIVYSSFRWTDGRFRFTQEASIDYDADHMSPVPTESILMEAAQMMDEWPMLEKKVRSRDIVFRRAPGVEKLRLVHGGDEVGEGILAVSRPEAEVWRWIDGKRDVNDLLERAFLSDFDVYKGLAELSDRNLIGEGVLRPAAVAARPAPRPSRFSAAPVLFWAAILGVVLLAVWLVPRNPWNLLLRTPSRTSESASLFKSVSLARLVALERGVRVFYDSSGQYPRSLEDLVVAGILSERALEDPYGRPYRYILRSEDGKFGLYGRNAEGNIDLDLSLDRTLAPVAEIRPAGSRSRTQERRPGVQVVE
jgi:Domain of unknown function (DUF4388)